MVRPIIAAAIVPWVLWAVLCGGEGSPASLDGYRFRRVREFKGHKEGVFSVAISADRRLIATGGRDELVKIWDVGSGEVRRNLVGHRGLVTGVAFSPDGKRLVSGGGTSDNKVKIWDVEKGHCLRTLEGHQFVNAVAFSPDGARILSSGGYDHSIRIWDAESGQCLKILEEHARSVGCVAVSRDGSRIISGDRDGVLKIWDAGSGACLKSWKGHELDANDVAIAPDGRAFASGSNDNSVRIWDLATGEGIRVLAGHGTDVDSVAYSPDGRWIASLSRERSISGSLRIWNVASGKCVQVIREIGATVAFFPDGKRLLASGDAAPTLWALAEDRSFLTVEDPDSKVFAVACIDGGDIVVTGTEGGTAERWSLSKGEKIGLAFAHDRDVVAVAYAPAADRVLTRELGGKEIRVWAPDLEKRIFTLRGEGAGVSCLAVGEKGFAAASGYFDGVAKIWDVAKGRCTATIRTGKDPIEAIAFAEEARRLATATAPAKIAVWRSNDGERIASLDAGRALVTGLALSPDGGVLVSASLNGELRIWDLATSRCRAVLQGSGGGATRIAFHAGGRHVASGGPDGALRFWDIDGARCLAVLPGHVGAIHSVAFLPGGDRILTCGEDNSIKVWDVAPILRPAPPPDLRTATVPHTPEARALAREVVAKVVRGGASVLLSSRIPGVEAVFTVRKAGETSGRIRVAWNRKKDDLRVEYDRAKEEGDATVTRTRWALSCAGLFAIESPHGKYAVRDGEFHVIDLADSPDTPGVALVSADHRWLRDLHRPAGGGEVERIFDVAPQEGANVVREARMISRRDGKELATATFAYVWARREGILFPESMKVSAVNEAGTIAFDLALETIEVTE